jgi:type I restriction enzyme S subunit
VRQISELFHQLKVGKRFEKKTANVDFGVPVIDQSAEGCIGYHLEEPGINATRTDPVVTFANHTCEMRLMRESFSVIQNVFPLIATDICASSQALYYMTKGCIKLEEYKGHFPNFREAYICVPSLEEQREISTILGALDDKIELNRRMNATLEEMARALFRAWFVDFDPVHARAAGEAPAHLPPETAALFPDSFGEDGLPEGWRMGILGEVATSPRRGVKPADIDPTTPYIGLEHMPRRSVALDSWEGASKVGSQKSAMRRGEFLFGKLRPYFHKAGIVPVDGICSTDIVVVAPKKLEWAAFVLSVISSDEFVEHTNGSSSGTRMPRTSWKDMAAFSVAMPQRQAALAFEERCRPMRERILANIHESRTLADLRDALLPRLMSGELRVRDAEAMVGGGV